MSSIEAPPITVVQPGGGPQGDLGAIGVAFKLWDRDTGGALSIVEHPFPPGALVPPVSRSHSLKTTPIAPRLPCGPPPGWTTVMGGASMLFMREPPVQFRCTLVFNQ